MNKKLLSSTLLIIMISGLALAGTTRFSTVKAATDVIGIISSDTTWTKANSPYSLTGPVLVNNGVTLTIEPGVTVNLNDYYIHVNGTLTAIGSSSDPIHINGGSAINLQDTITPSGPAGITFDRTSSGSVIEDAVFDSTQIEAISAPKIASTTGLRLIIAGNPLVTDNSQLEIVMFSGEPTIINNNVIGEIEVLAGSPSIIGNTVEGGGSWAIALGAKHPLEQTSVSVVRGNTVYGTWGGIIASGTAIIENNFIVMSGASTGIKVTEATESESTGNQSNIIIQNNTVVGSSTGVLIEKEMSANLTIKYNNFENISVYSIYCSASTDYNAAYNWWGTTDTQAISQSIHDFEDDFNLGKVTFVPFLTAPNPEAPAIPTSTQLSIAVDAPSAVAGSAVNVNGILTDANGTPLQDKSVTLSYAAAGGGSWVPIGSDTTDSTGAYSFQWVNSAPGTFTLKAEWTGNDEYLGASANTTLSFLPYNDQSFFLFKSNSTLTELFFNSTNSELSFAVTGPSGTAGYVEITIAKSLVSSAENVKAYLDGNELNVTIISNEDSWLLSFNYVHSTHQVRISLAADSGEATFLGTELWTWIAVAIIIGALLTVGVVFVRRRRRLQSTSV